MRIAVDFDGVIRNMDDDPIAGARETISDLREKGHSITIHSCNSPKFIVQWLRDHDIRFDDLWDGQGKPVAELYIDDRGLRFHNWKQVQAELPYILGDYKAWKP